MAYFCYILECADGTFYTGWTTDPNRRERQHNLGRGARYTATRRPVRLVYIETVPDHASALRRERTIKTYSRPRKERMIRESDSTARVLVIRDETEPGQRSEDPS